jgi:hypothetical protein
MALVDPNIALSYRGIQLQDPLDQYSKASAAQFNALKMDELMQERDALSQIRSAITAKGGPPDLEAAAQAMVSTGRPQFVQSGMAILEKLQNQKNYEQYRRDIEGAPAPANALAPAAATTETPPANALVAPRAAAATPVVSPQTQELINRIRRVSQLGEVGKPEAAILKMQLENQLRAELPPETLRTMMALGYPATQEGYQAFQSAQRTPPQPQPLVPVLENGKPVLRTREQAAGQTPFTPATVQIMGLGPTKAPKESEAPKPPSGYRFTPSGDLEPIPGGPAAPGLSNKDIQKREAVFPQATQAVKGFESKSDLFIKDLERLRDDPGLNQITGPIYGRTPSVSQAGSRAQALYDKIFAKGGFQALQDMREASKTGGALGNVSNEEGRRLEKSIVGGLDRTQNIKDVRRNINDLIDEIRTSKARVREAYDSTYDYRTQQGAAPSSAPGGAKADPLGIR